MLGGLCAASGFFPVGRLTTTVHLKRAIAVVAHRPLLMLTPVFAPTAKLVHYWSLLLLSFAVIVLLGRARARVIITVIGGSARRIEVGDEAIVVLHLIKASCLTSIHGLVLMGRRLVIVVVRVCRLVITITCLSQFVDLAVETFLSTHDWLVWARRTHGSSSGLFGASIRVMTFSTAGKADHSLIHLIVLRVECANLLQFGR